MAGWPEQLGAAVSKQTRPLVMIDVSKELVLPQTGLTYFWVLNGECRLDELRRQIAAFARAGVASVVLHPRSGLLVPYGSTDWFGLIRTLVQDCVAAGVQPWLYDEDPYPSGSCGGRLPIEYPEFAARSIERYESSPNAVEGELFLFPAGKLLWAGAVPSVESSAEPIDLTERVGMIRRQWEVSPWDSRWYYPATPLYQCPRSEAHFPEFALRHPGTLGPGWRIVAFVAQPVAAPPWGTIADSLSPAATALFIEMTHERYARCLGDLLGRQVPAIFTDEPKAHSHHPWTPGMFEDFQQQFGYDLRPRLQDLFSPVLHDRAMLTRLNYRQWCTERFIKSWLRPVSQWCKRHNLALIGHISPEDDPVEQVVTIGNYFPLQKHLSLAGLDLIIPAVGDAQHPILNVGITSATSAAQQLDKPGVMSETLGASGLDVTSQVMAKVLAWQTMSGVGNIVVHGAFASSMGLRRYDAPPNCGPNTPRWQNMCQIQEALRPFQQIVNARQVMQVAPVAIIWPIRSFQAEVGGWLAEDTGPRREFNQLLLACLQAQVGVHLLDEEQFVAAERHGEELRIGRAAYRALLLPSMPIIGAAALHRLRTLAVAGFPVFCFGSLPQRVQHDGQFNSIEPGALPLACVHSDDTTAWCRQHLPRLLNLSGDCDQDLRGARVTAWRSNDGQTTWLVMNLLDHPQSLRVEGQMLEMSAGQLVALRRHGGSWDILLSFQPASITQDVVPDNQIPLTGWKARWAGYERWQDLDRPLATYQLKLPLPFGARTFRFPLTGAACFDGPAITPCLEYRATMRAPAGARRVELILEPTAQRGRFTIGLNGQQWAVTLADVDSSVMRIDLRGALHDGDNELAFCLHEPMALDGIKVAPIVSFE